MMNLVTGATGHIGNVLIRKLLERGEKVRALIWRGEDTSSINDLPIEQVEGDVRDPASLDAAFEGVDNVYHLAGIISIMPGEVPFVWQVNVEGTRNVLEAARRAHIRRLVYTSSIHAIKRVPHGVRWMRALAFDAENPYGEYDRSKAAASLEVLERRAVTIWTRSSSARPASSVRMISAARKWARSSAARPRPARCSTSKGAYDFVDVRDVADGLIAAAENGRRGESYILGGHKISVRYLLETVREVTGKAFASIKIPFSLAEFAAKFTPWYYLPDKSQTALHTVLAGSPAEQLRYQPQKSRARIGFQPRPVIETIADTVRWFFEQRRIKAST